MIKNDGVEIIINKEIENVYKGWFFINDWIIAVRIGMNPKDLTLIQVCMQTGEYESDIIKLMYEQIEKIMKD